MAGHSKWHNIKNRKGAVDAKRGKIFSDLAKLIRIAVKEGKSDDPKFNPGLRVLLDKARAANMPKENIKRAVERGLGKSASGASIQETLYEAFGPSGAAFLITAHTDNPTRTSGEMRFILTRNGGTLASPGSAQFLFTRANGVFTPVMPLEILDEQELQKIQDLFDALLENEDVEDVFCSVPLPEPAE